MRLLFAKHSLVWPRASGYDIGAYYLAKSCAELGHEVSFATSAEPSEDAVRGLPLQKLYRLDGVRASGNGVTLPTSWLQRRFRSFYGIPDLRLWTLRQAVRDSRPQAVIMVGLDALPYFPALEGVVRVWYANDEWVWHHLSQVGLRLGGARANLRDAAIKGVYERAHARLIDRAWVVSDAERRAMRWFAGVKQVDVLPSGVDGAFYRPGHEPVEDRTAVFWGRLDFGPNVHALEWFCRRVWPLIRQRIPDARFSIIGFHPVEAVERLATIPGVTLLPNLPDLRGAVRRHSLVVLPFVSGGGIKSKLLEAAALGKPIVCTSVAAQGLRAVAEAPLVTADSPDRMSSAVIDLWSNSERLAQLGALARKWVVEHHTWEATAREALTALEESLTTRVTA
jgi:glycosyltransferase involved in cell wall biosynthesis